MLSPTQLQHLFVDKGVFNNPHAAISRAIQKKHHIKIEPPYLGMILAGKRTGYKYRSLIAEALGVPESKLFPPRPKAKRARQLGSLIEDQSRPEDRTLTQNQTERG